MRRLLPLWLVVALACGSAPAETSSPDPSSTTLTTSTTTPASTTLPVAASVEYTVADCDTPPVTFALLCDVYTLLAEHHVDTPLEPAALAAGAALGVEVYEAGEPGDPVESFVCAIPHETFQSVCDAISQRLRSGGDIGEMIDQAVTSMIDFSLDPFTYYLPPELSGALTEEGIIVSVGLLLTIEDAAGSVCTIVSGACQLEVVLAQADGPAAVAGLLPDDRVTAIDGEPVEGLTLVEIAGRLDGPDGSAVEVEIERDESVETRVIERHPPPVPQLVADQPIPGVGYIRLPDFGADIPQFVHETLAGWEDQLEMLVLDLRDNPGGFVDVATLVASEFLEDGTVLRSESPRGGLEYPVQEGGLATDGPRMAVLVNRGSASAAEIVAAVLQERGRASVVGEATFGKDTVQIGFPLRNDGELRVTVAHWVTPEGATVAIDGVTPDVAAEVPPDAPIDEVLEIVLG
ncbi:MAG TPA: S41 family peptidase [Acidimicrobiia bacterium]|nr:S41 family peptidase [Acidimicrobiia bacterium]